MPNRDDPHLDSIKQARLYLDPDIRYWIHSQELIITSPSTQFTVVRFLSVNFQVPGLISSFRLPFLFWIPRPVSEPEFRSLCLLYYSKFVIKRNT